MPASTLALCLACWMLAACQGRWGTFPPTQSHSPLADSRPTASFPSATPTHSIVSSPTAVPATSQPSSPPPSSTPTQLPIVPLFINVDNAANLQLAAELSFSPWSLVTSLAWSPDGSVLAVSSGADIVIYQYFPEAVNTLSQSGEEDALAAGLLVEKARLPAGGLSGCLAFSPDGAWLAAASRDGNLRVWQTSSLVPEPVWMLPAHKKGANGVAFAMDGSRIASGGNDAVVRIYNLESGEMELQIIGGTYAVPSLAYSPQNGALAITNGPVIRTRETVEGKMLLTFRPTAGQGEPWLYSLAFNADGMLLAAGARAGSVYLWDMEVASSGGEPSRIFSKDGDAAGLIWDLAFNPDSSLLAAGNHQGGIDLWNVSSGELIVELPAHSRSASTVAFHPGGTVLASGGLDAAVRFWIVTHP